MRYILSNFFKERKKNNKSDVLKKNIDSVSIANQSVTKELLYIEKLEPRILLSADAIGGLEVGDNDADLEMHRTENALDNFYNELRKNQFTQAHNTLTPTPNPIQLSALASVVMDNQNDIINETGALTLLLDESSGRQPGNQENNELFATTNTAEDYIASVPSFTQYKTVIVNNASDVDDGDTSDIDALIADPGDDGSISLREAIIAANNTNNDPGPDIIHFDLSGDLSIDLTSRLPAIDEAVIIDATSNAGYSGTPVIILDGNDIGDSPGFGIDSNGTTIKGFSIVNFSDRDGIFINGDSNTVQGNFIGLDPDGLTIQSNGDEGIGISGANNVIGGSVAGEGNIISGNEGYGIEISNSGSTGNLVLGNIIGLSAQGDEAKRNDRGGILVHSGASNNIIGGSVVGAGNVISGHDGSDSYGVAIDQADDNQISGNYIGTDISGENAIGNFFGVRIIDSKNTIIGGANASERNIISGNKDDGIYVTGGSSDNNQISANWIGIDSSGKQALANDNNGIRLSRSADFNIIGGTLDGQRNIISGNSKHGVLIEGNGTDDNKIIGNYVGLGDDGATALGNLESGIFIHEGKSTVIGEINAGNVISANENHGIHLDKDSDQTVIQSNIIGLSADKSQVLGNSNIGIYLNDNVDSVIIGGSNLQFGNIIVGNRVGVLSEDNSNDNNAVVINQIYDNTEMAVDWNADGVSANTSSDSLLNFPVLTSAVLNTSTLTVSGVFETSSSSLVVRIHFYANQVGDSSGHGEAQTYLGTEEYTVNSGRLEFDSVLNAVSLPAGALITANVSNSSNGSSEFARNINFTVTNNNPTGAVTIAGRVVEYETLSAISTIADLDGISARINYQWQRNQVDILDATGDNYTLTADDIGTSIRVVASYTDDNGSDERFVSTETSSVVNSNDLPSGGVLILGDAREGEILIVDHNIADADGISGPFNVQWQRDGVEIIGATSQNYQLTQDDVGARIQVIISYTDDQGADESVMSGETTAIVNINNAPEGLVVIRGTPLEGQELIASDNLSDLDGISSSVDYQWYRGNVAISSANDSSYRLTQNDVGSEISVVARYTDDQGSNEQVQSNSIGPVVNINNEPSGVVLVIGRAQEGQLLTASSTFTDTDGVPSIIDQQWYRGDDLIMGANDSAYRLTQADVGFEISFVVSYTDNQGTFEQIRSASTAAITNINNAPLGAVDINGLTREGEVLNVQNTLSDTDGLPAIINYQWFRGNQLVVGASGDSYRLTQADVGFEIRLEARYVDNEGTEELVLSGPTAVIDNINDTPSGTVLISGVATEGEILRVSHNLSDADGLSGAIDYQWYRGNQLVVGATGDSYRLTQADVGFEIRVEARYIDDQGTQEQVSSSVTVAVANSNNLPLGNIVIEGIIEEGRELRATNTITDIDGITQSFSYQWYRDGNVIVGATRDTYLLGQIDVGASLFVLVSYFDDEGESESLSSSETGRVVNVNDAPFGTLLISGIATEGETLRVSHNLSDADGLSGAIDYQWYRGNQLVVGATGDSYRLTQADVGFEIRLEAHYTDDQGADEFVTSGFTTVVDNINDTPSGAVLISGIAVEGETLNASHNLSDTDGLPTAIEYQWYRDNQFVVGASDENYRLTQADVGYQIRVEATYMDDQGTQEQVSSAATAVIVNINNLPIGNVVIAGTFEEGSELQATNTITDIDGISNVINYQWFRDGALVPGANGEHYHLDSNDIGARIHVVASYTDDQGVTETLSSADTSIIANVNDEPEGQVTIVGDLIEGATLEVNQNLSDADGLANAVPTYQWFRDGIAVDRATSINYVLKEADVGNQVSVTISYIDDQGTVEEIASENTSVVSNINDAPSGIVLITGDAFVGSRLSVSVNVSDEDGNPSDISYQWLRNGEALTGENQSDYIVSDSDVGSTFTVRVSFIDGKGTEESMFSTNTKSVRTLILGEPEFDNIEAANNIIDIDKLKEVQDTKENKDEEKDESQNNTIKAAEILGAREFISAGGPSILDEQSAIDAQYGSAIDTQAQNVLVSVTRQGLNPAVDSATAVVNAPVKEYVIESTALPLNTGAFSSVLSSLSPQFTVFKSADFDQEIAKVKEQLNEDGTQIEKAIIGGSAAVTTSVSVGYVVWTLRSGIIASSVLSTLPAWRFVDPLPILSNINRAENEDDETLESLVSHGDENSPIDDSSK